MKRDPARWRAAGPRETVQAAKLNDHKHSQSQLRFQRQVERLHDLGPRATGELLVEIAETHDLADDIAARLERYAALDKDLAFAIGADRFPPPPIHRVP